MVVGQGFTSRFFDFGVVGLCQKPSMVGDDLQGFIWGQRSCNSLKTRCLEGCF